jgi:hypothetical protein
MHDADNARTSTRRTPDAQPVLGSFGAPIIKDRTLLRRGRLHAQIERRFPPLPSYVLDNGSLITDTIGRPVDTRGPQDLADAEPDDPLQLRSLLRHQSE